MNIDDIRAEIPKAFGRLHTVSKTWLEEYDVDTRDFEIEDYYKTAANILVYWAYGAGLRDSDRILGEHEHAEYKAGYDDAAKDPNAWWVPDKHGEPVHIDEYAKVDDCDVPMRVIGFSQDENGKMEFVDCEGFQISADECEKVIPDSWEQLHDDIEEHIYMNIDIYDEHGEDREKGDRCAEAGLIADGFIARAKALAKGD